MSNTDLYNLVDDHPFGNDKFTEKYSDGLVDRNTGSQALGI